MLGVDPASRAPASGRALTLVGLRHLRHLGLPDAMLFVDADNTAAIRLYPALGFTRWETDLMFSRDVSHASGWLRSADANVDRPVHPSFTLTGPTGHLSSLASAMSLTSKTSLEDITVKLTRFSRVRGSGRRRAAAHGVRQR